MELIIFLLCIWGLVAGGKSLYLHEKQRSARIAAEKERERIERQKNELARIKEQERIDRETERAREKARIYTEKKQAETQKAIERKKQALKRYNEQKTVLEEKIRLAQNELYDYQRKTEKLADQLEKLEPGTKVYEKIDGQFISTIRKIDKLNADITIYQTKLLNLEW